MKALIWLNTNRFVAARKPEWIIFKSPKWLRGVKFFSHPDHTGLRSRYRVTEAVSGLSVGMGSTRKIAEKRALEMLKGITKKYFYERRRNHMRNRPRITTPQKLKPMPF